MIPDIGHLAEWQGIIDAVDKSNVPMEFISRIDIFFSDDVEPRSVDVHELRAKGYKTEDIEEIITQVLAEGHALNSKVKGTLEFTLDVVAVATTALQEVDKLLTKIPT